MRRLFYLVSSIDSATEISQDLHKHGVTDWRFHVLSKDEAGLYTHNLHSASIRDRTDLVRYVERGLLVGLIVALAIVLPLAVADVFGIPNGAWITAFVFLVIAGGWLGGFGGIVGENYRIKQFHDDINAGKYLIMVDAPKEHVPKVQKVMETNHPEAEFQGQDTSFNNPFATKRGSLQGK